MVFHNMSVLNNTCNAVKYECAVFPLLNNKQVLIIKLVQFCLIFLIESILTCPGKN